METCLTNQIDENIEKLKLQVRSLYDGYEAIKSLKNIDSDLTSSEVVYYL
jgi:hypothetical protein